MTSSTILRGMTTVSFYTDDMKAARAWYSELLGMEPYFEQSHADNLAYMEFRIGDYQHEFGFISSAYRPKNAATTPGGAILFWHVDDIEATFARLKAMGATEYEPITPRGEGFITASVIDPFGNLLGIMYNQHYLDTLNTMQKA